ncbi:type VII secretion target [Amycolatopsis sp. cmx-4-61]|uniref:type VII secretion target n=1 Tax=Amycolatopsis sp. cmx-4-61 TaxID=2790937 RepID=UPI00397B78AC
MPDGTTNGGGYQVRPDELLTHAKAVDQVGQTLGQALAAAEQVTMGVQAYGLICGPLFVPMVLGVSTPGLLTLGAAQQAMGTLSQSIRQAAKTYEDAEQAHSQRITGLGKDLA